jgi:hypothetical protein
MVVMLIPSSCSTGRGVLVVGVGGGGESRPVGVVALEPGAVVPQRDLGQVLEEVRLDLGVEFVQRRGVAQGDSARLLDQRPSRRVRIALPVELGVLLLQDGQVVDTLEVAVRVRIDLALLSMAMS